MSVKTNVPPSCSLQTQTTTRQVPAQPKPRGLLTHSHSFNPTTQPSQGCDEIVTMARTGSRTLRWDPHTQPQPHSRPQGAFWGPKMPMARLAFPCSQPGQRCAKAHTHHPSPQQQVLGWDHFTQRFHLTHQQR